MQKVILFLKSAFFLIVLEVCFLHNPAFSVLEDIEGDCSSRNATAQLIKHYRELRNALQGGNAAAIDQALQALEKSIFFDASAHPPAVPFDHEAFTAVAESIQGRLKKEIDNPTYAFLGDILKRKHLPLLKQRLELAGIDSAIARGLGSEGKLQDWTNCPLSLDIRTT